MCPGGSGLGGRRRKRQPATHARSIVKMPLGSGDIFGMIEFRQKQFAVNHHHCHLSPALLLHSGPLVVVAHVPNGFPRLRRICSASIQMYIYGLSGGGAGVVCHKTRRGMRRRRSSLSIGEIMCILCLYSITWINTIRRPRSRERRVG